MRRLDTRPLDGFNDTPVERPTVFKVSLSDGRSLNYDELIGNTPAVTSTYDGVHNPQLVLGSEDSLPAWDESAYFPVGRLASFHGRNLEVLADSTTVQDRFGLMYHSLCIKGSDMSSPYFFKSPTAERDYIIHGLQESLVMERVLKASQVLREHGVRTEYICGLVLPQTFPLDGEYDPFDIKTEKTLPEFLEYLSTRFAENTAEEEDKTPLEIKTEMMERFQDCDYLISYRAMDCPIRFGEIADTGQFEVLKDFIAKAHDKPELTTQLNGIRQFDYIYRYLSRTLALNVALMHKAGVVHGFLHANNITAMGSPIDLDSCRGEILGLGDEPVTERQLLGDIYESLHSINHVIANADPDGRDSVQDHFSKGNCKFYSYLQFTEAYMQERYDTLEEQGVSLLQLLYYIQDRPLPNAVMNMILMTKMAVMAHRRLGKEEGQEFPIKIPEIQESSFTRQGLLPSSLPSRFFRDRRTALIEDTWTVQDSYPTGSEELDSHPHSMSSIIRCLALGETIEAYRQQIPHMKPAVILESLAAMLDDELLGSNDNDPEAQNARQYFQKQLEAIVDRFCEPLDEAVNPVVNELMRGELQHLADRMGELVIAGANSDVLYLENASEYSAVFQALGIDERTSIELTSEDNTSDQLASFGTSIEEPSSSSDVLVLADYRLTEQLADEVDRKGLFYTVLHGMEAERGRPTLTITGITSGKPKVHIWHGTPTPAGIKPTTVSYQKLLDRYCAENPTPTDLTLFELEPIA
jgi:hypothetical protein